MGWSAATEFLKKYREKQRAALNNESRKRWFATDANSVSALMTSVFDTTAENSEWEKEHQNKPPNTVKLIVARTKIAFLAGWRRDARVQFARGEEHDPVQVLDYDRHAFSRLFANDDRTERLKIAMDQNKEGPKTS